MGIGKFSSDNALGLNSRFPVFGRIDLIMRKMKGKMRMLFGDWRFMPLDDSSLFNSDYADMAAALLAAGAEFMPVGGKGRTP